MALSEPFTFTATISTTEYSLTNNSTSVATQTDDGIYELFVDTNAMVAGDQFEFFMREKIVSGGTQRILSLAVLTGAQPGPFVTGAFQLMHGWDFTAKRLAGADRSFPWSIRKVA